MPRDNSPAAEERRREAAEARAAATITAKRAVMTPEELRSFNAATAAEKASHDEGGGHFHPELRPVELAPLRHISQWKWNSSGQRTRDLKAEPCCLVGCEQCLRESDDALSPSIGRARGTLRDKRREKAKALGVESLARAGY